MQPRFKYLDIYLVAKCLAWFHNPAYGAREMTHTTLSKIYFLFNWALSSSDGLQHGSVNTYSGRQCWGQFQIEALSGLPFLPVAAIQTARLG